jgi:hypothetical protein
MTERERSLEPREVRLPDGRRLWFYPFRDEAPAPGEPAPARSPVPPPADDGER